LSVPSKATLSAEATRELTAYYTDRTGFEAAVKRLLAAGFDRTDLSVLGSHDSLEVVGDIAGYHRQDNKELLSALGQQLNWLEPVTNAGAVFATAGPVGMAVAALTAAAAGAMTIPPLFDEITENAHAQTFGDAVAAGHILLWVRTTSAELVDEGEAILPETGGLSITRLAKPGHETPAVK